jgi:hypothetical protein
MATLLWISSPHGLANKFDPARIQYSPKEGVLHLAEAYNVDIDITGVISRRLGFIDTDIVTEVHSFFYNGGECLAVVNSALCIVGTDLVATPIRNLTPGRYMSYVQVGDSIIYMNGAEAGVVKGGQSWVYEMPTDPRYPDQTRSYNDPPVGTIVRYYAGRVYIADGTTIWYSEPFAPNLFRRASNFVAFGGKIVMIAPVTGGLFVSTSSKIYFLEGRDPKQFIQTTVAVFPAIEGTDVEVDGIAINSGKISPLPVQMFTTTKGICVGTADGRLINLTFDTLTYPLSRRGCAMYTGEKYIVSLEA